MEELKARVAACCRLLHMEGQLNYSGHVSARVRGRDALLIHPFVQSRQLVTAADILVCGLDCTVLPESPKGRPPLETFIHAEIYRARPDAQSVVHTHSELAAVFTTVDKPIQLLKSPAVRWVAGIPVHPDPRRIETPEQGRALAATLGDRHAALLRAHGGVLVSESIESILVDSVHFEENMRANVQAHGIGGNVLPLTEQELAMLDERSNRAEHVDKLWRYYVKKAIEEGVLEDGTGLL